MKANNNDIYGASLILNSFIKKKFPNLTTEMQGFISLLEFDKYYKFKLYGVDNITIMEEIDKDLSDFSLYTKDAISDNLYIWIDVNFSHMAGVIDGKIEEDCLE